MKSAHQILIKKPVPCPDVAQNPLFHYVTLDSFLHADDRRYSQFITYGHAELAIKELRNDDRINPLDEFAIVETLMYRQQ